MEQLLAHLIGDYLLQSHSMANKKTSSNYWALTHALTYSIPFLFLANNYISLLIITITHYFIDRYRLANYISKYKNYVLGEWDKEVLLSINGFSEDTPPFISFWVVILIDNTLHLLINYLALKYL